MKLLMTTDTLGGVWTYALELARALAPHGVEIALATMGRPLAPDQRRAVEQLGGERPGRSQRPGRLERPGRSKVRVFESRYRLEWMQDAWSDVEAAGEWLSGIAARFRPDLVHLNNYAHGTLDWGVPVLMVGHSCVCSWFREVRGQAPGREWDRYREEVTAGLRAADLVVAPTRAMLDWLEEFYGPLPRTRVILNGRDASAFRERTKQHLVLTAGRLWDEAKNVAAVAAVAPQLDWPVYVAGEERHPDGGGGGGVGGIALDGVRLLGRLDERALAEWYGRASIYVLPARYEPFGLTPLEAALAGCALVLGDIPTLREVWGDGACYVPPDDRAALARALQELSSDHARRDLVARARVRARRLSAARMAREYVTAYRELLGESRHETETPQHAGARRHPPPETGRPLAASMEGGR